MKHCKRFLPISPDASEQDILDTIEIETGRNFLFFSYFLKPKNETREWTYKLALNQFTETMEKLRIYESLKKYIDDSRDVPNTLKTMCSYLCNQNVGCGCIDLRYFYRSADGRGHVLGEAIRRIALKVMSDYQEFSRSTMFVNLINSVSRGKNPAIAGYRVEEAVNMSLSTAPVLMQVLRKSIVDASTDEKDHLLSTIKVVNFSEDVKIKVDKVAGIVVYIPDNTCHPYVDAMIHITRKKDRRIDKKNKSVLIGVQITIQDPIPKAKCEKSEKFLTSYKALFEDIQDVSVFLLNISPTYHSDPRRRLSILHIAIREIDERLQVALKKN